MPKVIVKISIILILNVIVVACISCVIASEYAYLAHPTAWGIIFASFVLILSFANMLLILGSIATDSDIKSIVSRIVLWLSGLTFAVAVYLISTQLSIALIDNASLTLAAYSSLLLFFSFIYAAKNISLTSAPYAWLTFLGDLGLLLMVVIHSTTGDDVNAGLFLFIGLISIFNISLITKLIWGDHIAVEDIITQLPPMGFYDAHKRELYFYVSIVLTLFLVFATPVSFCAYLGGLCGFGLQNELTRALLYIPILLIILIVRNIRTRQLFIELLIICILTAGGGVLSMYNFIKWSDVRGIDNIPTIIALIAVWVFSMIFMLAYQSLLIPFRRRMLSYVPLIACQLLLVIFASLQLADTVMPPPPSTAFYWPRGCFPEGTLVWTPRGNLPIESLMAGDSVFARDIDTQRISETPVIASLVKQRSQLMIINNELNVTPEHPMALLLGNKIVWKEAGKIGIGDCLVSPRGECRKVRTIQHIDTAPTTVINLSVSTPHDFFVFMGKMPVLVHNKTVPCVGCPPPPPDYSNEINVLATSSAVVVAQVKSIDWQAHQSTAGIQKEAVYTIAIVYDIKGSRKGTIKVQPLVSSGEIYKLGSTYVFFLATASAGGSRFNDAIHAEYVADLKYDVSSNSALSIDQLRIIAEKNENVIKIEGLSLPSPYFNGNTFAEYLNQRLQEISVVRAKTNATATWNETIQFLDTCEVGNEIQVNSATDRIEYWLKDKSHYVVAEKVSLDDVKRSVAQTNSHCDPTVNVKLPRFMSWNNAAYYLNHCDVDLIEHNNADTKFYLKDKTFSTIELRTLPAISEIKRSATAASLICGNSIPVQEFPAEIEALRWSDWVDAVLLLNKCTITGIWTNKDKSGSITNQLFTKDMRVIKLNEGTDKETANTAAIDASKKCGFYVSATYTDQVDQ